MLNWLLWVKLVHLILIFFAGLDQIQAKSKLTISLSIVEKIVLDFFVKIFVIFYWGWDVLAILDYLLMCFMIVCFLIYF